MGPGIAGVLIRVVGAPLALVANALLLGFSALILRGIRVHEEVRPVRTRMLPAMAQGLRFVRDVPLLRTMSICCATWQLCHNAAVVVQILFATRVLGLDAASVGLSYVALGVGTISGSAFGNRISMRLGPGPALVLSFGICSAAWLCGAVAPANAVGVGLFVAMLLLFGFGATLLFVTFIPLRQAVTPPHFLGRMTTTVRWLILIPAVPGALLGGFIGEHIGLRYTLLFSGLTALLLAVLAWRQPILRGTRTLPWPAEAPVDEEPPGPESGPGEYIP
jgi:predicted MFS family arabinose efflux permease